MSSVLSDSKITLAAARLRLPLTVPYRLAFGEQTHFDVLLVAVLSNGAVSWGEATILPGYTDETIEQGWSLAKDLTDRCKTTHELMSACDKMLDSAPFTATAFLTALDWLAGNPILQRRGRVELLGTVNGKADYRDKLEHEVETLLNRGYKTLKVKIGWEPEADLRQVNVVRDIVSGRAKLRVDGNQGYNREQAIHFLSRLEPEDIELVEQPCAAEDWDSAAAIAGVSKVPLMLDESIYTLRDIDRAAGLKCANYIKLKLMKLGRLNTLENGLRQISDHGMTAVLGNGVATDLGCWMELCVALGNVTTAGEMNGFLKTPIQLLKPALKCEGASVVIDGSMPEIDLDAVRHNAVERAGDWKELG
ncbi:MAG: mandelate racemase [Bradyrhizobiaceae bacterium]|nr:MAG: mandelate racemase [Bradyrhizobiaceae bacterium]